MPASVGLAESAVHCTPSRGTAAAAVAAADISRVRNRARMVPPVAGDAGRVPVLRSAAVRWRQRLAAGQGDASGALEMRTHFALPMRQAIMPLCRRPRFPHLADGSGGRLQSPRETFVAPGLRPPATGGAPAEAWRPRGVWCG